MARELGIGGSERQLTEIAKALDRSRFQPHVGCFRSAGFRGEELQEAGVAVARFPVTSFRSPSLVAGALEMGRYVRRHGIRLVHTFDTPSTLFGVPVARAWGVPVVLSSQRAYRQLMPGVSQHGLRITDQLVDAVVVNCKAIEQHLVEDEKVSSSLVRLCYNGIDTECFRRFATPRPALLSDASFVIGVICALRPEKGLPTLLKAFAGINDHTKTATCNLKLLIVGSGPELDRLQAQSRALSIASDCIFEPATSRVPEWLQAIDIFVLPSLSEAFSNSLMEAMACSCCAVASRVGGNPELVREGETGLLFTPGDSADLARKLELLLEQPSLRKQMAGGAARLIREKFALDTSVRRMMQIYSTMLEERHWA